MFCKRLLRRYARNSRFDSNCRDTSMIGMPTATGNTATAGTPHCLKPKEMNFKLAGHDPYKAHFKVYVSAKKPSAV
jgi:hypothetical protein